MASEQMENLKKIMQQMMANGFSPSFDDKMDPIHLRQVVQTAQEHMVVESGVTIEETTYADLPAIEGRTQNDPREDGIIIYNHGGGLICGTADSSKGYVSTLANATHLPVIAFTYRLAPENKFPAAVDDCFAVYQEVLKKYPGKPVFLIGESAGAYLSIVVAMKARDNGVTMPAAIIPYSPVIEMEGKLERRREGNKDFTVKPEFLDSLAEVYIPSDIRGTHNIYAEPYYDDFHGMCPAFLAWDESESLAPDSEIIVDRYKEQGIDVEYYSYPDCFHAFATTGHGTPESEEVLQNTVKFIHNYLAM